MREKRSFVIQKHAASSLHYDFRLELGGVLLSWAVPKGPSIDPADRRLAIHVEDHPLEYGSFEGIIPKGQYGSGTVMVWDQGTWQPRGDPTTDYADGRLKFDLVGDKLKGGWMLVRSRAGKNGDSYGSGHADDLWLLIKERDSFSRPGFSIVDSAPNSVKTGRTIEEIANGAGGKWHSQRFAAENVRAGALAASARWATTSPQERLPNPEATTHAVPSKASRMKGADVMRPKTRDGSRADPALLTGARRARLPEALVPMLATLIRETPLGDDWLHEIKYDGYRMLARIEHGHARVFSRNGKEWTGKLASIAKELAALPLASGWIDGEIAIADRAGRTRFQRLKNALGNEDTDDITYFLFDLPFASGYDLRQTPLADRKAMLRALLDGPSVHLRYGLEIEGGGAEVFAQACSLGLEGIVSKRIDSSYQPARGRNWVKVKCSRRQEMVVVGYTDPAGSRKRFGALLLGVYDNGGALHYAGRVGTGFDVATLHTLHALLCKLEVAKAPVSNPPRSTHERGVHWIKPSLVAEVAFTEWTDEGMLRHPSFRGLRTDKKPREVLREHEAEASAGGSTVARHESARGAPAVTYARVPLRRKKKLAGASAGTTTRNTMSNRAASTSDAAESIRISHPDKLLFADAPLTKRDLVQYYATIAAWMLPHITGRPLSLLRCPDGWQRQCFYQKHAPASLHKAVDRVKVVESSGVATYAEAHSAAGLAALAQWGVIEIHPWGSRRPRLDRPDRLIIDFDPGDQVSWGNLVEAAVALRSLLAELDLPVYLKTTGGKGLHVVVPIRPTLTWELARGFTRAIAESMARSAPERFVATASKTRRKGRIFIDYLRNGDGATAIAPYAVRARAMAPVSMPLAWEELSKPTDLRFDHFRVGNVGDYLDARRSDPWRGMADDAVTITKALRRRVGAD